MNNEDINILINDILNGTRDLLQFNKPEHAGVCSAGSLLIGALIVCDLARESLGSGSNASGSKTPPANWQIDEEKWYFSIVDVCGVLTDQPDYDYAKNYWKVLKFRLIKEGNESVTNCNQLKLECTLKKLDPVT